MAASGLGRTVEMARSVPTCPRVTLSCGVLVNCSHTCMSDCIQPADSCLRSTLCHALFSAQVFSLKMPPWGAVEMGLSVKQQPCKHGNLSSDPYYTHQKPGTVVCASNPSNEKTMTGGSLTKSVSFRFSEILRANTSLSKQIR